MALEEAIKHCIGKGKTLHVLNSNDDYSHFEGGTVDLAFGCF
jgi:hypothetical protein